MEDYQKYINLKKKYLENKNNIKHNQKGGVILNSKLEKANFLRLLAQNVIDNNYELFENNYNSIENINTFINSVFILNDNDELIFNFALDMEVLDIKTYHGYAENIYKIIITYKPNNIEKYFILLLNNYMDKIHVINYFVKLCVSCDNIDVLRIILDENILRLDDNDYKSIIRDILTQNSYFGYIDLYKFAFESFERKYNKKVSKTRVINSKLLLNYTIQNNNTNLVDVFQLLLDEEFEVDINILRTAIDFNKSEIIHYIFLEGVSITDYIIGIETSSLLYYAAKKDRATIFEMLYNLGADINDPTPNTPLFIALYNKCLDTLKFMLSTDDLKFVAKNDSGELVHISKIRSLYRHLRDNHIVQVFTEAGKENQLHEE